MYYNYDFEAHKNLSHNQLWLTVYYFMDYAVQNDSMLRSEFFPQNTLDDGSAFWIF